SPFGVETTRPAGSASVKPMPLSAAVVLLFCTVNCRLVEPFNGMLAAPNALISTGGPTTVTEAFEVLPRPLWVAVTVTLLFLTPALVPWTLTLKLHEAVAAIVPPDKLTVELPATAVMVPLPQEPESPFGVATTRPAGRLSVKATPLSASPVFGL